MENPGRTATNEAQPEIKSVEPAIKAVGLTKVFGERVVVDHLNLNVQTGELYALLGENGAGKTTTLGMLTTLLQPTAGEFYICGNNGTRQAEKTKGAFGVVSQDVAIYQELTAYENLAFVAKLYGMPKDKAAARIEMLLRDADLLDRANDIAGDFSGGMQRKLTIATALLHEPKVIFMDEPTVGLDPTSRRQIWSSLKELRNRGVTILLTTHYLEEAEILADRIGIIRKGKLVAEGTIEELRYKIQGIRSIAIRLSQKFDADQLKPKVDKLLAKFPTEYRFDALRQTISFAQPKDSKLVLGLRTILDWLDAEQIPFSKFSTSEPNLEEVFLAVAHDTGDIDQEKLAHAEFEGDFS